MTTSCSDRAPHQPSWTALGVPIDSVGAPVGEPLFGTELAPQTLRSLGIVDRLGARDAGDVDARITGPARDPLSGLVGGATVAPTVTAVRTRTRELVARGERPLLLGGCCTQLVGAFPAAVDVLGPLGLTNLDGHYDVYDHETSPTGEVADMPVALLLGRGESGLLAASAPPSLDADRLRVLGARDSDEWADIAHLVKDLGLAAYDVDAIRSDPTGVGVETAESLGRNGFWLALDVDVLDEVAFPATDYLMPGGLSLDELHDVMAPLGRDERCVGASIACYNPTKDPGLVHGRALVDLLVSVLGGRR
jgi:arginase